MQVIEHRRALHDVLEGDQHFLQRDFRQQLDYVPICQLCGRLVHIAIQAIEAINVLRSALEAFVLLQAPHEFGARIVLFLAVELAARQQHA